MRCGGHRLSAILHCSLFVFHCSFLQGSRVPLNTCMAVVFRSWYSWCEHVFRVRVAAMPPRSVVAAILMFWLAADGWLFYREVWPYWRAGDPPPYTIDLTEELGNASVSWEILKKGEKIGYATSYVHRRHDRTY